MTIVAAIVGTALVLLVLWEGFETIILPRRVTRRFRLTRLFYRLTWLPWTTAVRRLAPARDRETYLSYFGPLSLFLLITVWAVTLIAGFALIYWANGSAIVGSDGSSGFFSDLYLSGTTFFTLGLGDVTPRTTLARTLTVTEAGMGFAFLAMIISYLPALNQSFSRREVSISLLDARAGSPPTAAELLRRHAGEQGLQALQHLFHEWEGWAAEFLESHLSYPVLAYFRSQHDNQSWLAALTAVLDATALVMVGLEGACQRQARLTFAMARHAMADLSVVFRVTPREGEPDRLPAERLARLRDELAAAGLQLRRGSDADRELAELRRLYEPYLLALGRRLLITIPPWLADHRRSDNWQADPWDRRSRRGHRPAKAVGDAEEHF
ncbi:hypothetical protein GURASL_29370 [Geotalea uraniireducens]|uniref:Potassium channel domain-containing protein n=1 Tax=Geotalea uraniireducens TaxID=351604 RepID=A0ABN6VX59_9BACT|nr:potassium channel family protein [Geotalea uraniireducens]BDV44014.1 hypothetical protein GURASL_29370 [Geotalea uraniireducens]